MVERQGLGGAVFEEGDCARVACVSDVEFTSLDQADVGGTAAAVREREFCKHIRINVVELRVFGDDVFVRVELGHLAVLLEHNVLDFDGAVDEVLLVEDDVLVEVDLGVLVLAALLLVDDVVEEHAAADLGLHDLVHGLEGLHERLLVVALLLALVAQQQFRLVVRAEVRHDVAAVPVEHREQRRVLLVQRDLQDLRVFLVVAPTLH